MVYRGPTSVGGSWCIVSRDGVKGGQGRSPDELVGLVWGLVVLLGIIVGPVLVALVLRWLGVVR